MNEEPKYDLKQMIAERRERNGQILSDLREDANAKELLKSVVDDLQMGRISKVFDLDGIDLDSVSISPRFGVEQGVREDGTTKVRAVDNFTESKCNACTAPTEKLKYDTLDAFFEVLKIAAEKLEADLEMFKADIDSAFRRIPIAPSHREFAYIAFKY